MGTEPVSKDGSTEVVTETVEMEMLMLEQKKEIWKCRCWSRNRKDGNGQYKTRTRYLMRATDYVPVFMVLLF